MQVCRVNTNTCKFGFSSRTQSSFHLLYWRISGVLNFRNWIRFIAGGHIPYKYDRQMPSANTEIVFDVWNAHTKNCQYCQAALKNLKKIRFAAFFAATCLSVLRPMSKVLNLVSVLITAGVGLALNKLIGLFYRYEFSHAHND